MKRIKYIIPSLVVLSTLSYSDVAVDSVGAHIGYSNFKVSQTNIQGSIDLAKQPDEEYLYGELYMLLGGVFDDKSVKPTLNYMVSKNPDFLNNTLMAGINKYHYFENFDVYYGALFGYGVQKWEYDPINNTKDNDHIATSFVGALQLGAEYPLTKSLLLGVNAKFYKHDYETRLEPRAGDVADINHPSSYSIAVGLRYAFGETEEKQAPVTEPEPEQVVEPVVEQTPEPEPVTAVVPVVVLLDSDSDGILDKDDACSNTPLNAPVDEKGCALDSDADGIADYQDSCKNTPSGFTVDKNGCVEKFTITVTYPSGSSEVPVKIEDKVVAFGEFMKRNPEVKATITGHASRVKRSNRAINQKLSEDRAEKFMQAVVSRGISASRITSSGKGFDEPIADNATAQGRAKNRRLEISLIR